MSGDRPTQAGPRAAPRREGPQSTQAPPHTVMQRGGRAAMWVQHEGSAVGEGACPCLGKLPDTRCCRLAHLRSRHKQAPRQARTSTAGGCHADLAPTLSALGAGGPSLDTGTPSPRSGRLRSRTLCLGFCYRAHALLGERQGKQEPPGGQSCQSPRDLGTRTRAWWVSSCQVHNVNHHQPRGVQSP